MPRTPSRRSLGPPDRGGLGNVSEELIKMTRSQSRARVLATRTTITHRATSPRVTYDSRDKSIILTRQSRRNIPSFSPTPRSCLNVRSLSTPPNLVLAGRPQQQPSEASYNKVGLSEFASAIFDAPYPSTMLRDRARKLIASSHYDAPCQRFISSLESTSTTGVVEDHFTDVLSAICHHCRPLDLGVRPALDAFARPAYDKDDSDELTEEHLVMMGMRRGPPPDTWSWADLLVTIDIQPASSSFDPCSDMSSPDQQLTSPYENNPSNVASTSSSHQPTEGRASSPFALPPCGFRLRKYAESIMIAKGNRRHVLGLLVTGPYVSFWYFDRGGGVFSTPIHLITNAVEVAATIMRLVLSSTAAFGLEPIIQSPSPWGAFESVKDCYVVIDGLRFLLQKTLHVSRELEGRGTVVLMARKVVEYEGQVDLHGSSIPMDVIVKFSWQDPAAQSEDMFFRKAQECGVEGIAKLYCSSKPAFLSTGPRSFLGLIAGVHYHDRELRVQVMGPLCVPLYRVKEIESFKRAFRSLVEAHRSLYQKAGILHHDISVNNLMVEKNDEARGVLIDLDLAILVTGAESAQDRRRTFRGTLPFLSVDLLVDPPPRHHMYRYDLESFVFVLGWILVRFNEEGIEVELDGFTEWYTGTRVQMEYSKSGFLGRPTSSPASRFPSLQKSWLWKLGRLFYHGYLKRDDAISGFDDETLGGSVTYDTFLEILQ